LPIKKQTKNNNRFSYCPPQNITTPIFYLHFEISLKLWTIVPNLKAKVEAPEFTFD
jgi:hypothetical protein